MLTLRALQGQDRRVQNIKTETKILTKSGAGVATKGTTTETYGVSVGSYGCAPAVLFERRAGPAGLVAGRLFLFFLGATRVPFTCVLAPLMPGASICWAGAAGSMGVGSGDRTGGGGSIGTEHKSQGRAPISTADRAIAKF